MSCTCSGTIGSAAAGLCLLRRSGCRPVASAASVRRGAVPASGATTSARHAARAQPRSQRVHGSQRWAQRCGSSNRRGEWRGRDHRCRCAANGSRVVCGVRVTWTRPADGSDRWAATIMNCSSPCGRRCGPGSRRRRGTTFPMTRVGVCTANRAVVLRRDGQETPLPQGGYAHFGA